MRKWHSQESADTLEAQNNWCTSTRASATSVQNTTCQLVILREITIPKLMVCHPNMCIDIVLVPMHYSSILMYIPVRASAVITLFQICWLMKKHPLVSTLSAECWCCWHKFCRWEQPNEWTWQCWRALIEQNGIFEYYYYLQLADTLKYILKDILICIITEQYRNKGKSTWRR